MSISALVARLKSRPMLVEPKRYQALIEQAEAAMALGLTFEVEEPKEKPLAVVEDGTAVILVNGVLTQSPSIFDGYLGLQPYGEIRGLVRQAEADPAVSSIAFIFDSPGGEVAGVDETGQMIKSCSKPTTAFVDELCASAAYWLASSCGSIQLPRTGEVGSIGVVATYVDQSEALEAEGIKVHQIHAGAAKVDGSPYQAMTDDSRARLQESVDHLYSIFVDHVASSRGLTTKAVKATEARCFIGSDAVSAGLADGLSTFEQALRSLSAKTPDRKDSAMHDEAVVEDAAPTSPEIDLEAVKATAYEAGRAYEAKRIEGIEALKVAGLEDFVDGLKADAEMTPEKAAMAVVAKVKALGSAYMADLQEATEEAPITPDNTDTETTHELTEDEELEAAYEADPTAKSEMDLDAYKALARAERRGQIS